MNAPSLSVTHHVTDVAVFPPQRQEEPPWRHNALSLCVDKGAADAGEQRSRDATARDAAVRHCWCQAMACLSVCVLRARARVCVTGREIWRGRGEL